MPLALRKVFDTIGEGVLLLDYERSESSAIERRGRSGLSRLSLTKRYPASAGWHV